MPDLLERRSSPIQEFRLSQEDGSKRLSWYPALFETLSEDLGGFREKIGRRAFTKTLQDDDVVALFNHNPDNLLGRKSAGTLDASVDIKGLRATVTLPDTELARDIERWVERGDLTGGSFSFRALQDRWGKTEDGTPLREVLQARLFDVAPVVFPAYPDTANGGMAMRSAFAGIVDLENLMHPLLRARAGMSLDSQERERFEAAIEQLRSAALPVDECSEQEPLPEEQRPQIVFTTHYRYRLRLLELGRTPCPQS